MVDDNADITLGHSYDGIQEYDNRLPNWWLFTLYGSIVFAVGYWLFYETFSVGRTQGASYQREIEIAAQAQLDREMGKEVTEESLVLMTKVPAQVEAGAKIFQQKCAQCHGAQGTGEIGPNLTDDFWLHGPEPLQVYTTVMNGVLDKGMQSWKDQLGPVRVRQVVAYVLTRETLNLPGKAPQGKTTAEWARDRDAREAAQKAAAPKPASTPVVPNTGSAGAPPVVAPKGP
jgi:cytochrome c oxidase cbb3-type subunit 3